MTSPVQPPDRRHAAPRSRKRVFVLGGLAALLFLSLSLLIGATFLLPRLVERGGQIPNPIEMVMDLLFPPVIVADVVDLDGGDFMILDGDPIPAPPMPDDDADPPDM